MAVDTGKSCCADQFWKQGTTGLVNHLFVMSFRRETQVGHIQHVSLLPRTHQTVLRLDVSMDDIMSMDVLQTTKELVDEHQDCFERKLAAAEVEEVFQTWTQQVKNHRVILAFMRVGVDPGNTDATRKRSVDVSFTFEERGVDRNVFEFYGYLVTRVDIGCLYTVSESYEAAMTSHYLCIQCRSRHRRSSFADAIYRRHVDPDFGPVSVYILSVLHILVGDSQVIRGGEKANDEQGPLTKFPIPTGFDRSKW